MKVAVCNWVPDVHRTYDCQVVMNKTQQEIVGFGVRRLVPNNSALRSSVFGFRFLVLRHPT